MQRTCSSLPRAGETMSSRVHIVAMVILLCSITLWGVEAGFAGPPEWPECVTRGLTQGIIGVKIIDGVRYYVRRLATVFDSAIDDFGASAIGDSLEIFCVSRRAT